MKGRGKRSVVLPPLGADSHETAAPPAPPADSSAASARPRWSLTLPPRLDGRALGADREPPADRRLLAGLKTDRHAPATPPLAPPVRPAFLTPAAEWRVHPVDNSVIFPAKATRPKVQVRTTETGAGRVLAERRRREYASLQVQQLLRQLGVDPATLRPPPEQADHCSAQPFLPLEVFDDEEYETRLLEEWLQLGVVDGVQHPVPAEAWTPKGGWMQVAVTGLEATSRPHLSATMDVATTQRRFLAITLDGEATQLKIHRLFLRFHAEDPRIFAQRLRAAVDLRDKAQAAVRYQTIVDCMILHGLSPLPDDCVAWIRTSATRGNSLKVPEEWIKELLKQVKMCYMKTMAELSFRETVKNFPETYECIKIPPTEVRPVSQWGVVRTQMADFHGRRALCRRIFLYAEVEVYEAMRHVVDECLTVRVTHGLFATSLGKSLPLEEFQSAQAHAITMTMQYLKTIWARKTAQGVSMHLRDIGKGWFDIHARRWDVYSKSKLERMMWLIKSHMEEALWDMVTTSVSSFTRMVEAPCLGVPELPGDFAWGDDLVTSLFPPAPHQPLFALQLAIDEAGVGLSTDPDRFEVALVEVVNEAVRQTHQVPQVHPMVLANLRFARDLTLSSMGLLQPFMEEHRRRVASGLRRAVVPLKAYVAEYRQFLELWRKDVAEYLRGWSEPQRPAAELRDEALLQRQAAEDLEGRLPERLLLGPFALQVAPVKRALVGRRQDMAQGVLDIFAAGLRVQVDEVLEEFKAIMTKLCEKPASIEELLDLKDWMETIPANLETHGEVAKRLVMEYDMLDRFAYPVEAEDFAAKWDAAGFVRRIQMKVDDINQQLAEETERMKATHISDVAAMYDTIEDLAMRVHALAEEEDIAKVRELGQACSRLWEAMRESQESAALLVQRQRTFGLPPVAFEALPKLRREFEPYKSLWVTASEWLEWHSQWMDSPLETIEGENIDQVVTESARTMTRLYRTFSEAPGVQRVADEIRSKIDDFRPVVGLIQALRKPGMKPRHWKQIVDQTGIDVTLTPTLTFRQCLDMGLAEHTAAVEQVAEAAEKEFGLERGIAKITADWDAELMQLTPYKDTGTYIMKVADETVQMMDDNIIAVQQMLFSPYKDEFEAELNDLEERLRLAHVVLGEWFDCQKSWMYLQPIFSSDSIRKNLPMETNRFLTMERQWRRIMKSAVDNPKVLELCADRGLLRILQECNLGLEIVEKGLVAYLETKRDAFPRFYFLSDEELLEILSDATDPTAVQPHLRKCFENIAKLTFEEDLEITSMFSADGEQIGLRPSVRPIGDVESWLQKVEDSMRSTLRLTLADALADLAQEERGRWVLRWPGQLVIAGSQTSWTGSVEQAILGSALPRFLTRTLEQLDVLRSLVRGKLRWLERQVLSALIVIEVHARDVVISLIDKGVASVNDFEWISQLRYYWVEENLRIRMVNADFPYGYEYLGNTGRLVMTPLTDRCYLTLTGALHLQFGGAPAGPAGTGKTETTKDLAKAFAVQCVVFNCSDQLDYKAMGKFFTGLASAGAWACFDEFNRIDIEVLSVVAQQITTIQRAQMLRLRRFQFEEREIALKPSCAVFITMNPGYAGRTELPDNLKALFRPVAMMVPDYTLIAEISLFSFGFAAAKELAGKITSTFRLSSEQLSSQDHYDFGMRAVKTVIAAAGNLKREQPDMEERQVVLRALRDVNVPKFLADDLKLFDGIVSDLFPLMEELPVDYGILEAGVRQSCGEMRLEDVPGGLPSQR